jgi:hypothetical protein
MSQDFRDLLAEFNARGVEFLLVGAHAMAAHGFVRATEDLDIWSADALTVANPLREIDEHRYRTR